MAKKLISVWLSLTIVLFSSISIYAEENVQGDFFNKEVVINGSQVVNYNLQYPFFLYKDTTYIPLTPEMGKICGFDAEMDWESRTLKLLKTEETQTGLSKNWAKNNGYDFNLEILSGVSVTAYEELLDDKDAVTLNETTTTGALESETIEAPDMLVEEVDLGGLPVLAIGKYVFIPLKAMKDSKVFKWDTYFDAYYGLCISTNAGVPAKNFWSEATSRYNKGLVNYILNYNGSISTSYAQELVFMFKRAATVNRVDEKLLMAIAQKESTFNPLAVSTGGARGLMQIMPATGANFGLNADQLLDARSNIAVGAYMISNGLTNYGGDTTRALSAYNQGSARVSRGTYSTAYATRIMSAYSGVQNFLSANGYVN
ncbi:lytic transglycosylase domain-containing protein [Clostridium aminobutyricum]|uniref:Lytic transglycosylase domain-containing protein n=1 Tax=Clostridium aminobutyricum TaxID=33953 RepID=A0A939D963_CLOAM|nr:lytic transglycosylase domain-containing protein [Clostridium aminobutyricum]MBN7773063.1 lytic transglycosylase domain-containing protein [Clostridium aminobutyricum]